MIHVMSQCTQDSTCWLATAWYWLILKEKIECERLLYCYDRHSSSNGWTRVRHGEQVFLMVVMSWLSWSTGG